MNHNNLTKRSALYVAVMTASFVLVSQAYAGDLPSDGDNLSGDKLFLKTDLPDVKPLGGTTGECVPNGSRLKVHSDRENNATFRLLEVGELEQKGLFSDKVQKVSKCTTDNQANTYTTYEIASKDLKKFVASRSGPVFGGLLVPFKYNLSSKKLETSPTIAPFLGYRLKNEIGGLTVVPVGMLGISMKSGAATGSGTQAMFSMGGGLRLSSSKNEDWHGGILFGRDFGGGSEATTPSTPGAPSTSTQGKAFSWFSAFLGYSM